MIIQFLVTQYTFINKSVQLIFSCLLLCDIGRFLTTIKYWHGVIHQNDFGIGC